MIDTSYGRFRIMGSATPVGESIVDGQLVHAQPFQPTPLLASEDDPRRQDRNHALADLAHRAVDGVDEAASKIDDAPDKIRVGAAKVEQDGNAIADPVGKDLGVTKFLHD